jgi:hypothetical protein
VTCTVELVRGLDDEATSSSQVFTITDWLTQRNFELYDNEGLEELKQKFKADDVQNWGISRAESSSQCDTAGCKITCLLFRKFSTKDPKEDTLFKVGETIPMRAGYRVYKSASTKRTELIGATLGELEVTFLDRASTNLASACLGLIFVGVAVLF